MTKSIKARRLAKVEVKPGPSPESFVLALEDTISTKNEYLIGPDGLSNLLLDLLDRTIHMGKETNLDIGNRIAHSRALAATHVVIERGRTSTECALTIFFGKTELTFLIPVDSMLSATAKMVKEIDPNSGLPYA